MDDDPEGLAAVMTLGQMARRARRAAGAAYRYALPSPEVRAWRHACTVSERTPRFTPGTLRMMDYEVEYSDLLTFCPQWEDIFIDRSLAFHTDAAAPRILDCGANIGLSALFYKRAYPNARITAYEADPAIAAQLGRNLRANGAADVDVVAAAVWTTNGVVSFTAQGADAGSLNHVPQHAEGKTIDVPSIRLADVLARERVDLLKLDIEGAELEVLRDIEPHLANVAAMQLEVHEFRADCRALPEILKIVANAGFRYSITRVTQLPWLDTRRDGRDAFPQSAESFVAAVAAWRPAAAGR